MGRAKYYTTYTNPTRGLWNITWRGGEKPKKPRTVAVYKALRRKKITIPELAGLVESFKEKNNLLDSQVYLYVTYDAMMLIGERPESDEEFTTRQEEWLKYRAEYLAKGKTYTQKRLAYKREQETSKLVVGPGNCVSMKSDNIVPHCRKCCCSTVC